MMRIASAIVLLSAYSLSFGVQYRFHDVVEYSGPDFWMGGMSDDGRWILGAKNFGTSNALLLAINRDTGSQIVIPNLSTTSTEVPQRLLNTGEILGTNRTRLSTGMPGSRPFVFDPNMQTITQLPNPLDAQNYNFRVHDVLNDNEFIGRLWWEQVDDIQYARWTRTNGVWTASLISTGSAIYTVAGYDREGYIYGQYGTQPCRWDRDLNRTILQSNSATPYGQVAGRLPDGRYVGMLYYSNFGVDSTSVVTWDNLTAAPVVHGSYNESTYSLNSIADNGTMVLVGNSGTSRLWDPVDGLRLATTSVIDLPAGVNLGYLGSATRSGSIAGLINGGYAILDPVPEPTTLAALAMGLAPLIRRRRKD